jgi:SAM-dependent methyltransferase
MSFDVPDGAYGRFMGRYSEPLAVPFAEFVEVVGGQRLLDVGCGPGALTAHLSTLTAPTLVTAVDPSPPFVEAVARRCPYADVHLTAAESLPFLDDSFDAALAELVVHFMRDPVAGLREMARVTKPGGRVAACVWDGPTGALGPFWQAVHAVDPAAEDESNLAGAREGHLTELLAAAGLEDIESAPVTIEVEHTTFDEWWEPYTLGVGPAGDHVASLDTAGRQRLAAVARATLGDGPFVVSATAWSARGRVAQD